MHENIHLIKIILAILFLVALIAVSDYFINNFINKVTDNMLYSTEKLLKQLNDNGDYEQILILTQEARDYWEKHSSALAVFIDHNTIEPISNSLDNVYEYLKNDEILSAKIELLETKNNLIIAKEREKLSFYNVL